MPQTSLPQVTQRSSYERVRFVDGMVVHAEDLEDAIAYPLDIFRTLVRAFFGCGVVCGLEVKREERSNSRCTGTEAVPTPEPTFVVRIEPGVALDAHGYPLEICRPVRLDLEPRSSSCAKPERVCIAIRRITSDDVPRPRSDCRNDTADDPCQYTRVRDHVQIKVFPEENLPRRICMYSEKDEKQAEKELDEAQKQKSASKSDVIQQPYCECMKKCGACTCGSDACDESWVLLACVEYDMTMGSGGLPREFRGIKEPDITGRRYVKPIACLCRQPEPEPEEEEEERENNGEEPQVAKQLI